MHHRQLMTVARLLIAVATSFVTLNHAMAMDVIAHFRMGENMTASSDNAVADDHLIATDQQVKLKRESDPKLSNQVAKRAKEQADSSRSLRFEGSEDAYRGAMPDAAMAKNFVTEAWIRLTKDESYGVVVNVGGGAGVSIAQQKDGIWGIVEGRGTVGFRKLKTGQWVHVAMVVGEQNTTLWINGEKAGTFNKPPWGFKAKDPLVIGRSYKGKGQQFVGEIDEVRIFTFPARTFTPKMLLYNGGQPADFAHLKPKARPTVPARPIGHGHPLAQSPGVAFLGVVFNEKPDEKGMSFDRAAASAVTLNVGNEKHHAWQVARSNVPQRQWERAFQFRIDDPAFQNGGRPAVDISFEYMLDTWAGVDVYASTQRGWQKVGSGWGDTQGRWRRLDVRLDDAWFGDETDGMGGRSADGFDLIITGANAPLRLRRIELVGYDAEQDVYWPRMLRLEQPQPINGEDNTVFVFRRRAGNAMQVQVTNLAAVDRALHWRVQITDWAEQSTVHKQADTITVPAAGNLTIRMPFNTSSWALGPYQATVELRLDATDIEPLLRRRVRLGIVDDDAWQLSKAANDAPFFYGLDAGNTHIVNTASDAAAVWYALMGVDVLRGLPLRRNTDSREKVETAIAFLEANRLRAGFRIEPPKPTLGDVTWRESELQRRAELLAWGVEQYAGRGFGRVPFVELGNEPDLPFFWPGEIDAYVTSMTVLAESAQQAKQSAGYGDDDVLIANGGLSFAGPTGDQRSREFLRQLQPDLLDAIAFHAHGPGLASERMAYERLRGAMADTAAEGLPVFDTESGYNGTNAAGLIEQARTAVEKLAYAQSVDMPSLFFFRLFMEGDRGYGMTDHRIEPRPSVMAYRQMVRTLRDYRFVRQLDTQSNNVAPGVVAYLFHSPVESQPDRWALLAFSTQPSVIDLNLNLSSRPTSDLTYRIRDMFGNDLEVQAMAARGKLRVGVDPVYLLWQAEVEPESIQVLAPTLQVRLDEPLPVGHTTPVTVQIDYKPATLPLQAKLLAEAKSRVGARANPNMIHVQGEPASTQRVSFDLELGEADMPLSMPSWWRVFLDADVSRLSTKQWATIPRELTATGGQSIAGQQVMATDGHLDFAALAGGMKEKRPVAGFAYLDSPRDVDLPVAASADWWMAWYVNGEQVYSTLDTGNRHGGLADHTFTLPLKQGRNVIAFQCLSGSAGWSLTYGGPRERTLVLTPDAPPDQLKLTLRYTNAKTADEQVVSMPLLEPLGKLGDIGDVHDVTNWQALTPLAVLGDEAIENRWNAEPDQSLWYQGPSDLSATVWLRETEAGLRLLAQVRDDVHETHAKSQDKLHDHLRLVISGADGGVWFDQFAEAQENAIRDTAIYHLLIPKEKLKPEPFRVSLRVYDTDAGTLKQTLELGNVDQPNHGVLQVLAP